MMFGGLKKSASRLALVAAAGVLSTNAYAADLGGDCCADLEERVAELEATTARKGTRKTSLEVYGHVNKLIIGWNDGINHNVALGIDNVNQSTRFGFRGMAKVTPELSAGYSIVIEQATGGRSTNISQFRDKNQIGGLGLTPTNPPGGFGSNDAAITMREANWWLESKSIGRVTVGRFATGAGPQGTIDLGGIGLTVASGSMSLIGTGLTFRTNAAFAAPAKANTGNFTNYTIGNTTDSAGEYSTRQNGIQYTSPVFAGFTFAASLGGSVNQDNIPSVSALSTADQGYGPTYAVGLKYAGEFSGVRLAAAVGYEDAVNSNYTSMISTNGTSAREHSKNVGVSLSLMHVATGLFGQGFYNEYTRGHDLFTALGANSDFSNGVNGASTKDTAKQWLVQGGISKNWFGLGNTAIYGEYGQTNNGFNTFGLEPAGATVSANVPAGTAYSGDVTKQKLWGLGIQQDLDAAAMQIFAGYRNFSIDSANCTNAGGCKDIGMLTAGSKIRF